MVDTLEVMLLMSEEILLSFITTYYYYMFRVDGSMVMQVP